MQIKKIFTSQAIPGMIAADDVYTFNNQLIISKDTHLTDRIITRLKFYSVYEIPILLEDEVKIKKSQSNISEKETYLENVRKTPEFKKFLSTFVESVDEFKEVLDELVLKDTNINAEALFSETKRILAETRNGFHLFDMLHSSRKDKDATYVHSVNVALICHVFGGWLKFSDKDIKILTLCGLLHDVGKLKIPQQIIDKPSNLTDIEYLAAKMHTIKGHNILKDKNIDQRIINSALMHHEKCDGSGYPNGFVGNQIDDFAKIVAIADIYDAMTSARVYRGPLCPFEVIGLFESEGYQKYDPHYLLTFLEGIVQTYMHNQVRLSNGLIGEIIMLNKNAPTKPVIQVNGGFIDLSKYNKLSILEIL